MASRCGCGASLPLPAAALIGGLVLCLALALSVAAAAPASSLAASRDLPLRTVRVHWLPSTQTPPPSPLQHLLLAEIARRCPACAWRLAIPDTNTSAPLPAQQPLDADLHIAVASPTPTPAELPFHQSASAQSCALDILAPSGPAQLRLTLSTEHALLPALGRLLRELRLHPVSRTLVLPSSSSPSPTPASASSPRRIFSATPAGAIRGHQIGFYFGSNISAFEDFVRELAVFGTNQIEFAHWTWGAVSPSLPPSVWPPQNDACSGSSVDNLVAYSAVLQRLGLRMSLWWPMDLYTADAGRRFQQLLERLARLDSLFVPGGDGGLVLAPADMVDVVGNMTALARRHFAHCEAWLSAQEYSAANMTAFFAATASAAGHYITGLAYGPHVRIPLTEFVARTALPVRQYPDLCHSLSAEFEVPYWHHAFAYTHGRLVVNPNPRMFGGIAQLRMNASYAPHVIGFGAYSEGVSDDLNKCLWSALYADRNASIASVVEQYTAYFFGDAAANISTSATAASSPPALPPMVTEMLYGLERNWQGDPGYPNEQVLGTLAQVQAVQSASSTAALTANWRLQAYLFRGFFDAYVKGRLDLERELEARILSLLGEGGTSAAGAHQAVHDALAVLASANVSAHSAPTSPALQSLHQQTAALASAIDANIGGARLQCQEPALGMDTIDSRISDLAYLQHVLSAVAERSAEQQLGVVQALVNWTDAGPDGAYDQPGSVSPAQAAPHLQPGAGWAADPAFFYTPLQAMDPDGHTPVDRPIRWTTYVQAFYDASVDFVYSGLRVGAAYKVTVVYFPGQPPVRLLLNRAHTVHDYAAPPSPAQPQTFRLPADAVGADGRLRLSFNQQPGQGGSGRCAQISELWLTLDATVIGPCSAAMQDVGGWVCER